MASVVCPKCGSIRVTEYKWGWHCRNCGHEFK